MHKPVVIVGAGLAGLACARKLHRAGIPFLLLEADDRVGGRLKTDEVNGFKLDRGFQIHLTAYPNARRELDIPALGLKGFPNAAIVYRGGKLNLVDESKPFQLLKSRYLNPIDLYRLRGLSTEIRHLTVQEMATMEDESAIDMLRHHGLSKDIIEKFLRPFFGGIFLDRSLEVSSRQFAFVWKMLLEGQAALPEGGIEALPKQIAAEIPRYLMRLGARVERVSVEHGKATGVVLDTGETFVSDHVVVATEADVAARITGLPTVEGHRSCITLYFEIPKEFVAGGYLVLNGEPGALVNEVAPLTAIQPSYAPAGKHLASATILGDRPESDEQLAEMAKTEIAAMFPKGGVNMWSFIRAYRVRYAQYAQPAGVFAGLPRAITDVQGLYFAGEFTTNSSIDGALQSGATCGNLLARQLSDASDPVAA